MNLEYAPKYTQSLCINYVDTHVYIYIHVFEHVNLFLYMYVDDRYVSYVYTKIYM